MTSVSGMPSRSRSALRRNSSWPAARPLEKAVEDGLVRVRGGHAVTVEGPVGRDGRALLPGQSQLAPGHYGCRHVENDGLLLARGYGHAEGIGGEGRRLASIGRQD